MWQIFSPLNMTRDGRGVIYMAKTISCMAYTVAAPHACHDTV